MKYLLLVALLFVNTSLLSHDEDYIYNPFELIIVPSFEPITAYLIVNEDIDEPSLLKGTFSDWKNYQSKTINTESNIRLTKEQLNEIKSLVKGTLKQIKLDD